MPYRSLPLRLLSSLFLVAAVEAQTTAAAPAPQTCPASRVSLAPGLGYADNLTVSSPRNFLRDYPTRLADGLVNAVVEIPAGSTEKWEVKPEDGVMRWDIKNGRPRLVNYLGYPFNYGMVPQTRLGKELGGDGDPLDMVILGPAVPRGTVVPVKVIGILRMTDTGEGDDKLLGVPADSPLAKVDSVAQLEEQYPGVLVIVRTFFENYKGKGVMQFLGTGDAKAAMAEVQRACESHRQAESVRLAGK